MSVESRSPIAPTTRMVPSGVLPGRQLDRETVVVDPPHRRVYLLNSVGGTIWAGVQRGDREEEIVAAVVARFRVDGERARRDVDNFLLQLESSGLAVRSP